MVTHSASQRAHVIATGIQIASENNCPQENVSIRLLAKRAKVSRTMAQKWWTRRQEFLVRPMNERIAANHVPIVLLGPNALLFAAVCSSLCVFRCCNERMHMLQRVFYKQRTFSQGFVVVFVDHWNNRPQKGIRSAEALELQNAAEAN